MIKNNNVLLPWVLDIWRRSKKAIFYQINSLKVKALTVMALEVEEVRPWEMAVMTRDRLFSTVTSGAL